MSNRGLIIKGVSIACGVSVILIAAVIWQALFNTQRVNYLAGYLHICVLISLLAGGFYTGYREGKKGWLVGGSVGLIYSGLGLFGSLLIIPRVLPFGYLARTLLPGIIYAGMAGVCGVNIGRAKNKQVKKTKILSQKALKHQ